MKSLIPLVGLLFSGCVVVATKNTPSEPPPEPNHWATSCTVTEFAEEMRREQEAALALEAKGTFLVRAYPAPSRWAEIKQQYPDLRLIWRFEPDACAASRPDIAQTWGHGFAVLDAGGRVIVFHDATGHSATPSR